MTNRKCGDPEQDEPGSESAFCRMLEMSRKFRRVRQEQKSRGLNDFNLFTTLLDASDEVRLHSRFIAELLDPNGTHGQGALFLRSFLYRFVGAALKIEPQKCRVFPEYVPSEGDRIDIYVTDGSRQLVVENKIRADDQENQIERYVDAIAADENKSGCKDIAVVYLSLYGEDPSDFSLGGYEIVGSGADRVLRKKTTDGVGNTCLFRAVSYHDHVRPWMQSALAEVSNITNLKVALDGYLDVIERLYGRYQEKAMDLAEFMNKENKWRVKDLKTLKEMVEGFDAVRTRLIGDLLSQVVATLEKKLKESGWYVRCVPDGLKSRWKSVVRVSREEKSDFGVMLLFNKDNAFEPYFSVAYFDYPDVKKKEIEEGKNDERIATCISSISKAHGLKTNESGSLCWRWMRNHPVDLFDLALNNMGDDNGNWEAVQLVAKDFLDFIDAASPIICEFLQLSRSS